MSPPGPQPLSNLHSLPLKILRQILTIVSLLTVCDFIVPAQCQNTAPTLKLSMPWMGKDVLTVSEETPIHSLLSLLEVHDPDQGPAGTVDCRIENKYVGFGNNMGPNYYKVELVNSLDREEMDVVNVDIICTDNGSPPLSKKAFFTIVVTDVNDNAPTFPQEKYSFSLPEHSQGEIEVGVVHAFDADKGENGEFEYSLDDETLFSIDSLTGRIVSLLPIDREMVSVINLFVYATDHGSPSLFGKANVTIQILDINDNAPTILIQNMTIEEAQPSMSLVGTILGSDLDIDENGEIEYSLVGGDDGTTFPPFMVDSKGTVLSVVPLDREKRDDYVIQVTATDSGDPPLTSTASIYIAVLDVNDNPPIILTPSDDDEPDNGNSSDSVTIDWYGPDKDKTVFKVIGADVDLEENGRVYYGIESINSEPYDPENSLFGIHKDKGTIFLQRAVRDGDEAEQILSIVVYDGGNPSLSSSASLNVTFDINFSALTLPTPTSPASSIRDNGGNRENFCILLFLFNSFVCLCLVHHNSQFIFT